MNFSETFRNQIHYSILYNTQTFNKISHNLILSKSIRVSILLRNFNFYLLYFLIDFLYPSFISIILVICLIVSLFKSNTSLFCLTESIFFFIVLIHFFKHKQVLSEFQSSLNKLFHYFIIEFHK